MRSVALASGALVSLALSTAGCGVKEDASLYVYARNTTLTKSKGAFDKLDGSVDVFFDLGKWTQGPAKIEGISLGLYRDGKQILARAKIEPPAGTTFPIDLAPGGRHTIKYSITISQLIDAEPTELCAGPVKVTGTVKQSGQGELQIDSTPVTVAGCP